MIQPEKDKKIIPRGSAYSSAWFRGFTLIELIVALAAFSLVVLSISGIFISVINSQRKILSIQNTQEAGRYLLESMTKEIRMSTINSSSAEGVSTLYITNSKGEDVNYVFDNTNKRLLRQNPILSPDQNQILSPDNIELTGSFYITKKTSAPEAPKVTIVMKLKAKGVKPEQQAVVDLQTTVSARGY